MRSTILLRQTLLVFVLAGFSVSPALLLHFTNQSSSKSVESILHAPKSIPKQEQTDFGLPARIQIPKINVDTVIEHVGLTAGGAIGVPKNQADTAWFNIGPRPGENGSAIITGHYGWKDRKPSAFDNLYKLRKGDKLYIIDDRGVTTTFVMRTNQRYNPNENASGLFNSTDGKSHLNLITCEGIWNKILKSYSKRLVVFFDKE